MAQGEAITIGGFDGVHLGHVALLRSAREVAGGVTALCFDPHPLHVLNPAAAPPRLSTFEQREAWLKQAGAETVVRIEATRELLNQPPEHFLRGVAERARPGFIVEGPDFRFGRGRAGTIETLRRHESELGYETIIVDPVQTMLSDQTITRASSTMVRWLTRRGRMNDAAAMLGRAYELRSIVVEGAQTGREIGVPTANLDTQDQLLPADGVYAGVAERPDGAVYRAAISVGRKPTFGGERRLCEAHLLGFDGPLDEYGWVIRLEIRHWLRDQLAFPNVGGLIEQMHRDIEQVGSVVEAA